MKKWQLSGRAKRDLADIRRFTLEQWGSQKAEDYFKSLYEKIRLAAERPAIGIDCSKSLNLGHEIRSIVHVSHIIYYAVLETHISVVAILHQRMAPKKHLQSKSHK
jgi:toxin ParE1/3/4